MKIPGFKKVLKYSFGGFDSSGAIINADNLTALKAMECDFSGSFSCVYLDPPYNNGDTYSHYDDRLDHDEWIAGIVLRLKAIKPLLSKEGSVWISIDDSGLHYLKVACDQVLGRDSFIGTIVWERRTTRENRRAFSRNHEYILVYAADSKVWSRSRNLLPITAEIESRYKNPDNDPRGPWQSVTANVQAGHATDSQFYRLVAPSGASHIPPKGRCWVYSESKMNEEIEKGNIWFGRDGLGAPRIKNFLSERRQGVVPETLWRAVDVGTTSEAKKELIGVFEESALFDTPKPERLMKRVLEIATNPGDLILDPYLGSATTAAVAHKLGRRFVGIEIGEHAKTHCAERLRKVCGGEQGGISREVCWKAGGGFDFLIPGVGE